MEPFYFYAFISYIRFTFKPVVMKTKLLLGFLFCSFLGNAQAPINTFYIDDNVYYSVVDSATPIDQTGSGANQVWNFDQLTEVGTSNYTTSAPTSGEATTYPGTTDVILGTFTPSAATSQLFTKNIANTVSITGLSAAGLELNFSTNNALLGTFPLSYGYNNTDAVAGTYTYTTYSGTFTGNIVTSVDAYGTLTRNTGGLSPSAVTRLKTVITISLNYSFFTNIGTITQTSYSYYSNTAVGFNGPLFRAATTTAVVPLASIDQTDTTLESFSAVTLGVATNVRENQIQITPNPVKDRLYLNTDATLTINSATIVDSNGRTVLAPPTVEQSYDLSRLQKGIYFINLNTNKGKVTKKIIKE